MLKSYKWVQNACNSDKPIYGVNTGFGSLARVRIPPSQSSLLSTNLIRSHSAGVGPIADEETTRAMILLRANALSKGVSGCRPLLVDTLIDMLNKGLLPMIPMQGSCGSSGDLAPLAHLGLVLIGDPLGEAIWKGERLPADQALAAADIPPLILEAKDGLAITNGAQLSTALATLNILDSEYLIKAAEIAAAMSIDALLGVSRAFHPEVHKLRPYRGAKACAANLCTMLNGSELIDSVPEKVQDAYSLRCTPQVLGAVRDTTSFVYNQVAVEVNSATDNPLILLHVDDNSQKDPSNKAFSAGMFHGEPIGMAMDMLKIAIAELASLSERRLYRLTTGNLSQLLPPGLVGKDRPLFGMIVPQTTAASLVSENKALAWPASVDSIPTCEDQEDHIAMSTVAARRMRDVLNNSRRVIAIELLSAAHALQFRLEEHPDRKLGIGVEQTLSNVRACLYDMQNDNPTIGDQIEELALAIQNGRIFMDLPPLIGIAKDRSQ
jgi:histidine ammonia-lyase